MNPHRLPIFASALLPALLFGQGATHALQPLTPPLLAPSHSDYVNALAALQGKPSPAPGTQPSPSSRAPSPPPPMVTGTIWVTAAPTIAEKSLPLTSQEAEA